MSMQTYFEDFSDTNYNFSDTTLNYNNIYPALIPATTDGNTYSSPVKEDKLLKDDPFWLLEQQIDENEVSRDQEKRRKSEKDYSDISKDKNKISHRRSASSEISRDNNESEKIHKNQNNYKDISYKKNKHYNNDNNNNNNNNINNNNNNNNDDDDDNNNNNISNYFTKYYTRNLSKSGEKNRKYSNSDDHNIGDKNRKYSNEDGTSINNAAKVYNNSNYNNNNNNNNKFNNKNNESAFYYKDKNSNFNNKKNFDNNYNKNYNKYNNNYNNNDKQKFYHKPKRTDYWEPGMPSIKTNPTTANTPNIDSQSLRDKYREIYNYKDENNYVYGEADNFFELQANTEETSDRENKSPTPLVREQKPTRRKPSSFWDVPPKGYEHITPLQYKAMQAGGQIPTLGGPITQSNASGQMSGALPREETIQPLNLNLNNLIPDLLQQDEGVIIPQPLGQFPPQQLQLQIPPPLLQQTIPFVPIQQLQPSPLQQQHQQIIQQHIQQYQQQQQQQQLQSSPTGSTNPQITSHLAKQARRLYVGNIPFGITEELMLQFFNEKMYQSGLVTGPGNSVTLVQINHDKNFAFLEFRTVDECTNALVFDGITLQGQSLRIRRPNGYANLVGLLETHKAPTSASFGQIHKDSPYKLFIGGLPCYLNDEQVKELLLSFGPLKAFNLVKDSSTGLSKGYAFCEYQDSTITDIAIQGLNGMQLGEKKIIIQRASVGSKNTLATSIVSQDLSQQLGIPNLTLSMIPSNLLQSRVLCMLNMVVPSELIDDQEYQDIVDDIRDECTKYGQVMSLEIPRPIQGVEVPGVGKVYVEFFTPQESSIAQQALAGRSFSGRTVVTSLYCEEQYKFREFY